LRQAADRIGFDMKTGLHLATVVDKPSQKGNCGLIYALCCVISIPKLTAR